MLRARDRDAGSITVLVIGYTAIVATLVIVGVDVSKVFLARRALSSAADAAALAAAQSVDRDILYSTGGGCGDLLPLTPAGAEAQVTAVVSDDLDDLRHTFASVDVPQTSLADGQVAVHLSGAVAVPFGHVLSVLLPGYDDGLVRISVTSTAEAPFTAPQGC